jgi:hypothetical protein
MNAYEMLEMLRDNVGEVTESHWTDKLLLRRLNIDQRETGRLCLDSPGDWLLKKSASISPSSNQLALPSDCVRPAYVEEVSSGRTVPIRGSVRGRAIGRDTEAYLIGNYLEINETTYTNACYIWYQQRIKDLHAGICGTGTGAAAVVFEAAHWPSGEDDYYNDIVVQVRDASDHVLNVNQAISDYTGATFTAVIASPAVTPASGDFYGTVSELPEELHGLIVLRATVKALAKPSSTFEKELFAFFVNELKNAQKEAEEFLATRLSASTYTQILDGRI